MDGCAKTSVGNMEFYQQSFRPSTQTTLQASAAGGGQSFFQQASGNTQPSRRPQPHSISSGHHNNNEIIPPKKKHPPVRKMTVRKCRSVYGMSGIEEWCKACRRKNKCTRFLDPNEPKPRVNKRPKRHKCTSECPPACPKLWQRKRKCRSVYGKDAILEWCTACRRKNKCTRFLSDDDEDEPTPGSSSSGTVHHQPDRPMVPRPNQPMFHQTKMDHQPNSLNQPNFPIGTHPNQPNQYSQMPVTLQQHVPSLPYNGGVVGPFAHGEYPYNPSASFYPSATPSGTISQRQQYQQHDFSKNATVIQPATSATALQERPEVARQHRSVMQKISRGKSKRRVDGNNHQWFYISPQLLPTNQDKITPNGTLRLCRRCSQGPFDEDTCPLLRCSMCSSHFHTDCEDPPVDFVPTKTFCCRQCFERFSDTSKGQAMMKDTVLLGSGHLRKLKDLLLPSVLPKPLTLQQEDDIEAAVALPEPKGKKERLLYQRRVHFLAQRSTKIEESLVSMPHSFLAVWDCALMLLRMEGRPPLKQNIVILRKYFNHEGKLLYVVAPLLFKFPNTEVMASPPMVEPYTFSSKEDSQLFDGEGDSSHKIAVYGHNLGGPQPAGTQHIVIPHPKRFLTIAPGRRVINDNYYQVGPFHPFPVPPADIVRDLHCSFPRNAESKTVARSFLVAEALATYTKSNLDDNDNDYGLRYPDHPFVSREHL